MSAKEMRLRNSKMISPTKLYNMRTKPADQFAVVAKETVKLIHQQLEEDNLTDARLSQQKHSPNKSNIRGR